MDKDITREYTNGEVTVIWKPATCIHSKICWQQATGLPAVFDPRQKPWIRMQGATTREIVAQVQKCPSGALGVYYNNEAKAYATEAAAARVEIILDGPLIIYGDITVKDHEGREEKRSKATAFCRCGLSQRKPYCDGSHAGALSKG